MTPFAYKGLNLNPFGNLMEFGHSDTTWPLDEVKRVVSICNLRLVRLNTNVEGFLNPDGSFNENAVRETSAMLTKLRSAGVTSVVLAFHPGYPKYAGIGPDLRDTFIPDKGLFNYSNTWGLLRGVASRLGAAFPPTFLSFETINELNRDTITHDANQNWLYVSDHDDIIAHQHSALRDGAPGHVIWVETANSAQPMWAKWMRFKPDAKTGMTAHVYPKYQFPDGANLILPSVQDYINTAKAELYSLYRYSREYGFCGSLVGEWGGLTIPGLKENGYDPMQARQVLEQFAKALEFYGIPGCYFHAGMLLGEVQGKRALPYPSVDAIVSVSPTPTVGSPAVSDAGKTASS